MAGVSNYKTFDLSTLTFSKPYKYHNVYKSDIYISSTKKRLFIQTPKMVLDDMIGLKLSFNIKDQTCFEKFLEQLDRVCKKMMVVKSKEWFSKEIPEDHIEKVYKSNYIAEETEEKTLTAYLESDNENILTNVYNIEAEKIDSNALLPSDEVLGILKLDSLLISKSSIKCVLKIAQIKICTELLLEDYCINSESDEEPVDSNFKFDIE